MPAVVMKGLMAPLQAMHWDGCTLSFSLQPGREIELWLDGARFVSWPASDSTRLHQDFAFAPNGRAHMQLQLRCRGAPLHQPLEALWGELGLQPDVTSAAAMRLPSRHAETCMREPDRRGLPVTIIVPVYNAAAAVARCLAALRQYTPAGSRLLLIDDASTDPAIAPLLRVAAEWPNVTLLRNPHNLGFTGTVNRGLGACDDDADVVLLNADTEVGPGWLAGLRQAARARPEHATATAVSDNAGAFSVPELEQANPLPQAWSLADAARALLHDAGRAYPHLPTGNGFCMYIRCEARARVGPLDADAFPAGYGEENDWCQRAERCGWQHVIAGPVLVGHARSQSFGEQRRLELGTAGMQVLRERYPDYEARVGAALFSYPRLVLDWRVRRLWQAARFSPRARVLLDVGEDADAWAGWAAWRLHREHGNLRLLDAEGGEQAMSQGSDHDEMLANWLQRYAFEAVASADDSALGQLATALGIPVTRAPAEIAWAFR